MVWAGGGGGGRKEGSIFKHLSITQTRNWFKRTLFINEVWAGGGGVWGQERRTIISI